MLTVSVVTVHTETGPQCSAAPLSISHITVTAGLQTELVIVLIMFKLQSGNSSRVTMEDHYHQVQYTLEAFQMTKQNTHGKTKL